MVRRAARFLFSSARVRGRRNFAYFSLGFLLITAQVYAGVAPELEQGGTLTKIHAWQIQLEEQRRALAGDAEKQQWHQLAEKWIFAGDRLGELRNKTARAEQLALGNSAAEALELLVHEYRRVSEDLDLIGRSIEAEKRAELTRTDSKMYFDMRVRSPLPPKTLKAYGLMELARQERERGNFAAALQLWEQAELMVRESFDEHIATMAEWRQAEARAAYSHSASLGKR